jgi:hypothetical protein
MSIEQKRSGSLRALLVAGGSAIALVAGVGGAVSQTSELDSYDSAVRLQSKTDALEFIRTFPSSHLVGDLIESLRPEVAQQVCADLRDGGPRRARNACKMLQAARAVAPVEPAAAPVASTSAGAAVSAEPAEVLSGVPEDPTPANAGIAVDNSSNDEVEGGQRAGGSDGSGGADGFLWPQPAVATKAVPSSQSNANTDGGGETGADTGGGTGGNTGIGGDTGSDTGGDTGSDTVGDTGAGDDTDSDAGGGLLGGTVNAVGSAAGGVLGGVGKAVGGVGKALGGG